MTSWSIRRYNPRPKLLKVLSRQRSGPYLVRRATASAGVHPRHVAILTARRETQVDRRVATLKPLPNLRAPKRHVHCALEVIDPRCRDELLCLRERLPRL